MFIIFRDESIVDTGEFAGCVHCRIGFITRVCFVFWIEFPARHGGIEFVSRGDGSSGAFFFFGCYSSDMRLSL